MFGVVWGNAMVYPIPNFTKITTVELVIWGLGFSTAIIFAGFGFIALFVRQDLRIARRSFLGAFVLVVVGCTASSRGHWRQANENIARYKATQEREAIEQNSSDITP